MGCGLSNACIPGVCVTFRVHFAGYAIALSQGMINLYETSMDQQSGTTRSFGGA